MLDQLTAFGIISLINCVTCVFIGLFILLKNRHSAVNVKFFFFDLCIAFYAFFYFLWQSSSDLQWEIIFFKWCIVGVVLINSAFVDFTMEVLDIRASHRKQLWLIHAVNAFFCYAALFLFYRDWQVKFSYGLWPIPSAVFHCYIVWWFAQVIYSFYLIGAKGMARAQGKLKKQFQWIFWSTLVAYAGGSTNWLVWYGINFPPYLNSGIAIYTLILAYAIFRFQLLGIEVIIRNTFVFAGLVAFVFGVFTAATILVRDVLNVRFGASTQWSYLISIFIVVLGYDPLRKFLMNLTDRYFFQKKYDYRQVLRDASRGMAKIESLEHLIRLVIHFVTMRIRVRNAAAVLWNWDAQNYRVFYARGYRRDWDMYGETIAREHPLIQYLYREKEALDIEKVRQHRDAKRGIRKKGEKSERQYDFGAIFEKMETLRASCVVPSFLGRELRSILMLGEKKSGDLYADQDLNVLYTLAQESAIAIENARLYDEAVNKSRELAQINKQLEEASRRLILALNEAEEANKRLLDTQAQLIHEQKMATLGRLAASVGHEVNNPLTILSMNVSRMILKYRKDPNLKVSEVSEYFDKIESNIQRIKAVVNTLTGLLKKSEKGKFEALSLKLVIEETLPLVQFQTYLDNLAGTEVEFDIPAQIPLIKGDLERLQEVFLNLFTNAYHALASQKERHIKISAVVDESNPKFVVVTFTDNGCGMGEETVSKIFNYGFTTKGEGRGSGIGLYMCRYIIELHGGEIKVKSLKGTGTAFTLTLPIYEEQMSRMVIE